jgi:hypothetical protein
MAAPAETVIPAQPDVNPLGDDPDVIPFDRSTPYDHGFAWRARVYLIPRFAA